MLQKHYLKYIQIYINIWSIFMNYLWTKYSETFDYSVKLKIDKEIDDSNLFLKAAVDFSPFKLSGSAFQTLAPV